MITHIMNQSDYKELYKQRCFTRLNSMVSSHACMFSNSQNEYGTTFVVEKWSMYGLSTIGLSNKYEWIAAMRNHSCFFYLASSFEIPIVYVQKWPSTVALWHVWPGCKSQLLGIAGIATYHDIPLYSIMYHWSIKNHHITHRGSSSEIKVKIEVVYNL